MKNLITNIEILSAPVKTNLKNVTILVVPDPNNYTKKYMKKKTQKDNMAVVSPFSLNVVLTPLKIFKDASTKIKNIDNFVINDLIMRKYSMYVYMNHL